MTKVYCSCLKLTELDKGPSQLWLVGLTKIQSGDPAGSVLVLSQSVFSLRIKTFSNLNCPFFHFHFTLLSAGHYCETPCFEAGHGS